MARTVDQADMLALVDSLASGEWVSGAQLAMAAGVSREALSKRVRKLAREWQLPLETRHGRGYRLKKPLQRLSKKSVQKHLNPAWRNRLRIDIVPSTGSTNSDLLAAPERDDPQLLLAELQTAGRGRRGREWLSPFGANLYLSLGWTFPAWPPQLTTLPLMVGVCCIAALRETGLKQLALKWPNDLRVGEAKLGGILVEQRGEASGPCRVIIGVGINVAMSASQAGSVTQPWVSLEAALAAQGHKLPDRNKLAATVAACLADGCQRFEQDGFEPFAAVWDEMDMTRGRPVSVLTAGDSWNGIARGINADGALRVETPAGIQLVHAGDVSLRVR